MKMTTSRAGAPTTSSPGTEPARSSQNPCASRALDSSPSSDSISAGGWPWIRTRSSAAYRLAVAARRSSRRGMPSSSRVSRRRPYGGPGV
ncbi:MAG: hypothetical protein GEV12_20540 [Micromonosporaceae bacterium]|nr:hypothetical protein [Micromonosporaceae bacterium]